MFILAGRTPQAIRDEIVQFLEAEARRHTQASERARRLRDVREHACRANSLEQALSVIKNAELAVEQQEEGSSSNDL